MDECKRSWPVIVGISAGIIGGIIASAVLYSMRNDRGPDAEIRDAEDIIAQCRSKIKEIETRLEDLKQPTLA